MSACGTGAATINVTASVERIVPSAAVDNIEYRDSPVTRLSSPVIDVMSSGERRRQVRRERACPHEHDAASGRHEPDRQRPVGDDAHTLEMPLADRFRVREHALSDTQEIAIGRRIERGEKRLELRLHLRLAGKRRSKSADHFQQEGVGVGASHDGDRSKAAADTSRTNSTSRRHVCHSAAPGGHGAALGAR